MNNDIENENLPELPIKWGSPEYSQVIAELMRLRSLKTKEATEKMFELMIKYNICGG